MGFLYLRPAFPLRVPSVPFLQRDVPAGILSLSDSSSLLSLTYLSAKQVSLASQLWFSNCSRRTCPHTDLFVSIFILCVWVPCLHLCLCIPSTTWYSVLEEARRACGIPWELELQTLSSFCVCAGNETQVLWKRSECAQLLSHLHPQGLQVLS